MGCGVSKLEPGEGPGTGHRPVRQRIEDMRRRRNDGSRARKDSIVSTTELLVPEDLDDGATPAADEEAFGAARKGFAPPVAMRTMTTPPHVDVKCVRQEQGGEEAKKPKNNRRGGAGEYEDEEEENKKRGGGGKEQKRVPGGPALVDCRRGNDDEETPGSPSFRVYFAESPRDYSDDESVVSAVSNAGRQMKEKKGGPGRVDSIKSNTSEESSVGKLSKRHRGTRRFKGLPKGPSAVYGLLNVRSCYSVQGNGSPQENPIPPSSHGSGRINHTSSNVNSSLTSEKVA